MQNVAQKASRISVRSNLSFQRDGGYIVEIQFDSAEFSGAISRGTWRLPGTYIKRGRPRKTYLCGSLFQPPALQNPGEKRSWRGWGERELFRQLAQKEKDLVRFFPLLDFLATF